MVLPYKQFLILLELPQIPHCMKSVQILNFFWSVFYRIRTRKISVFGHFSRSASFVATFCNIFCSYVSINLVTGSMRIEQNKFVSSAVQLLVVLFFHDFYYFFYAHHNLKSFLNMIACRLLVSFLLSLFHINKKNLQIKQALTKCEG